MNISMIRVILFVFLLVDSSAVISSCWCQLEAKSQFDKNEEVLLARITNFRPSSDTHNHGEKILYEIDMVVLETFKGKPLSKITAEAQHVWNDPTEKLQTVYSGSANIEVGTEYILFRNPGQTPVIDCCSIRNPRDSNQIHLLRKLSNEANGL
jgi:hypothetical protein